MRSGSQSFANVTFLARTFLIALVFLAPRALAPPELPAWLPPDVRAYLQRQPEWLLDDEPPSLATLQNAPVGDSARLPSPLSSKYAQLLAFLKTLPRGGDYYFAGNGMFALYQMAKTLTEGTPLESKIHFLPVSRYLFRNTAGLHPNVEEFLKSLENGGTESPKQPPPTLEELQKYFRSLGMTPAHKGPIVLIDSVSWGNLGNKHSLLLLQDEIMLCLQAQGMDRREALRKVIPVGIPENSERRPPYRVTSLAQYLDRVSQEGGDAPGFARPFIDLQMLDESIFAEAYGAPRWNGFDKRDMRSRFSHLDASGKPAPDRARLKDLFERRSKYLWDYEALIDSRLKYVDYYKRLDQAGRRFLEAGPIKDSLNRLVSRLCPIDELAPP